MEDCPRCGKPVLDHGFSEALTCGRAHAQEARALIRQALTQAEDTVDGTLWTRAASVRAALDAVDQAVGFAEEALPSLKGDDEE